MKAEAPSCKLASTHSQCILEQVVLCLACSGRTVCGYDHGPLLFGNNIHIHAAKANFQLVR